MSVSRWTFSARLYTRNDTTQYDTTNDTTNDTTRPTSTAGEQQHDNTTGEERVWVLLGGDRGGLLAGLDAVTLQ